MILIFGLSYFLLNKNLSPYIFIFSISDDSYVWVSSSSLDFNENFLSYLILALHVAMNLQLLSNCNFGSPFSTMGHFELKKYKKILVILGSINAIKNFEIAYIFCHFFI